MILYTSIAEVLIVLSACFMDWLFEIGAGVCGMMTGCLIGLPGYCFWVVFFLVMGAIYRSSRMREIAALFSFPRFSINS